MWHCSVAGSIFSEAGLQGLAVKALKGYGDASKGEWWMGQQLGGMAKRVVHLRRRLSDTEAIRVGRAIDYRDNPFEKQRRADLTALRTGLPASQLMELE